MKTIVVYVTIFSKAAGDKNVTRQKYRAEQLLRNLKAKRPINGTSTKVYTQSKPSAVSNSHQYGR